MQPSRMDFGIDTGVIDLAMTLHRLLWRHHGCSSATQSGKNEYLFLGTQAQRLPNLVLRLHLTNSTLLSASHPDYPPHSLPEAADSHRWLSQFSTSLWSYWVPLNHRPIQLKLYLRHSRASPSSCWVLLPVFSLHVAITTILVI